MLAIEGNGFFVRNIFIFILVLVTLMLIALSVLKPPIGPHGGELKYVGKYRIEYKNNYPDLYVYLLNKYEKPIENKGVSCRAKFIFFNEHEINDTLKAEGLDGFKLKLKSHDFYLCRIIFIRHGESISADFENNDMIALTSNNHHQ